MHLDLNPALDPLAQHVAATFTGPARPSEEMELTVVLFKTQVDLHKAHGPHPHQPENHKSVLCIFGEMDSVLMMENSIDLMIPRTLWCSR
jgi:hypothetical protein